MTKDIEFKEEARRKIFAGVEKLADAVEVTLGAAGRSVMIVNNLEIPILTKDGVSVARSIEIYDSIENAGKDIVRQASEKTAQEASDGTSTTVVLARAILREGMKKLDSNYNVTDLKVGMDKAVKSITGELERMSVKVDGDAEKLKQVASISANNNQEIGDIICKVIDEVGFDGAINISSKQVDKTYFEVEKGLKFDRGMFSKFFETNSFNGTANYDDAKILITDSMLTNIHDLVPILTHCVEKGHPLIIFCEEIEKNALASFISNKVQNGVKVVVTSLPDFGELRVDAIRDLASVTGTEVVYADKGMKLKDVTPEMLGTVKNIIVSEISTTIIIDEKFEEVSKSKVEELKLRIPEEKDEIVLHNLKTRMKRLIGGVGVIYVGGATPVEWKEKFDRVEDSLGATRSAIEEGVVAGGGVSLIIAGKVLKKLKYSNEDEKVGGKIIEKAITSPLSTIVRNAGGNGEAVVAEIVRSNGKKGYNAKTKKFVDMFEAGIIDPKKVTRVALENANSVASLLMTTDAVIFPHNFEK